MDEQKDKPEAQTAQPASEKKDVVMSMDALEAETSQPAPVKKDVVVQVEALTGGGMPTRI